MRTAGPVATDIVLVGGGHAHVQVMTRLAMAKQPGLRVTLVTPDFATPYSGMLPGHVAGAYERDEIHIDLARLGFATGTRVVRAEAVGVDRAARRVLLADRPPLAYDILSLNVGIVPDLAGMAGAAEHAVPVKPIAGFLERLDGLLARLGDPDGPRRFLVVGGGAAGVELALGLRHRLTAMASGAGLTPAALRVAILSAAELVPNLNGGARRRVAEALQARGIAVEPQGRVVAVAADHVLVEDGRRIAADAVLVSTRARAPDWLAGIGLESDADGSVLVRETLQSVTDPRIFAAGDCAALASGATEKAGVYAVRQGPVLAENLLRLAAKRPLREWRPQKRFLVLLNTGDGNAIAARGRHFAASGTWVWRWKDAIDRRFMRMFARFGRLGPARPDETGEIPEALRCGGCAAKIGPAPLAEALRRLPSPPAEAVARSGILGLGASEDAAIIRRPDGRIELESVDLVRDFIGDPYLFGEIAALHALSDIHAMGGRPLRAMALAQLPSGLPAKVAEDLHQLLAGARTALDREDVVLAGGHSAEAPHMALGFAVAGEAGPEALTRKGGARDGDVLVLTKALGTGIIFAAAMRGAATGQSIAAALASQRLSNAAAAACLRQAGAHAVTDVTGFGLAGHLGEMLAASGLAATLSWPSIPVLPGAGSLAQAGYVSSLLGANREGIAGLLDPALPAAAAAVLLDPQTSGGLMAAIPPTAAGAAVAALHRAGYPAASVIGRFHSAASARSGALRVELDATV